MQTKQNLTGYPSIDKPWLKYYSEEAINASLPECTMYEFNIIINIGGAVLIAILVSIGWLEQSKTNQ